MRSQYSSVTLLPAVVREAVRSAMSHKVASAVILLLMAAMCAVVVLTAGRSMATRDNIVDSIDSAGTRTIVVRAAPEAHLTADAIERIELLDGVALTLGFSQAQDVQNVAIPRGGSVALRSVYGSDLGAIGLPEDVAAWEGAYLSASAQSILRMEHGSGGLATADGRSFSSLGVLDASAFAPAASSSSADSGGLSIDVLSFLEPFALAPRPINDSEVLGALLVVTDEPQAVEAVAAAVPALLAVDDPSALTLETSEDLATVRQLVDGELEGAHSRLVLSTFGSSSALVAIVLGALVMLSRKDYGRRRALGATRGLIVSLMVVHVTLLSSLGTCMGVGAGLGRLAMEGAPLPSLQFIAGLMVCATILGAVSSVLPGLLAATRDPLRELRVP